MYFLVLLSAFFLPLNSIGAKLNRTKEKAKLLGISFLVGGAAVTSWLVCLLVKQTVTGDMYLYAAVFAVICHRNGAVRTLYNLTARTTLHLR